MTKKLKMIPATPSTAKKMSAIEEVVTLLPTKTCKDILSCTKGTCFTQTCSDNTNYKDTNFDYTNYTTIILTMR